MHSNLSVLRHNHGNSNVKANEIETNRMEDDMSKSEETIAMSNVTMVGD